MNDDDRIRTHLRRWRECLLDRTARNPLLKLDGSRISRLRIVSPEADSLFRTLVLEQGRLRLPFVRSVRKRRAAGTGPGEEPLRIEPGDLAFAAGATELKARLRRIRDNARISLEERGVVTLHVALGFLHFPDTRLGGECAAPLWMVPCRLESHGPDRPMTLEAADEDARLNPTLELYLRERHKMLLPETPEEPSLDAFLAAIDRISDDAAERGWRVEPDAWLSTFSFESLVLWRDLEAMEDEALRHPVVGAFTRVAATSAAEGAVEAGPLPEDLDSLPVPDRVPVPILETDSSQLEALTLASDGCNLVVHGPPGTGKSQTIANLIADALGKGKTVLFVSAKLAALEVVHRRLVEQGLGDFCLEAHSARTGKTKIVAELRRVLENAAREPESPLDARLEELATVRERLNGYVRALHEKRGALQATLHDVIGRAEEHRTAPDLRFALPWSDVLEASAPELDEIREALEEVESLADVYDGRDRHAWRGFVPPEDPAVEQNLEAHLEAVADGAERLSAFGLPFGALDAIARERQALREARAALAARIRLDAADVRALLRPGLVRWRGIGRFFSPAFHRWNGAVRVRLRAGTASDPASLWAVLRLADEVVEREARVAGSPDVPVEAVAAMRPSIAALGAAWPDGFPEHGEDLFAAPLDRVAARARALLGARDRRDAFQRMLVARERALGVGLEPLLDALGSRSVREARGAFERRFHFAWAAAAIRADEALALFEGERQERLVERFREADVAARRAALRRVHETVSARAVGVREAPVETREVAFLRRELVRRRSRLPLRKLFGEAPRALQALKPCMLMSPVSVSTWLPPGSVRFDLVVFDEASQIRTPQAVPAILRAAQTVVAGDPKQLPPSSFFDAVDEEREADDAAADVEPLESLLDECVASVPAFREAHLRWHYRSHDERLIQFSNHWFYEDRLITFPSTAVWSGERGVRLVHAPDGVWDRGRTRRNLPEARRVASVVFELLREHPERSLGVIAMNAGQKEAIEDAIAEGLESAPDLRRFFGGTDAVEPFFVKALENVQGDERDVIVVSLGYGRDASGSLVLNFGPLNDEGGWRRLNVLVTRAKRQTVVVSSLRASDLAGVNAANRGACALRDYLAYAEGGGVSGADAPVLREPEPDGFADAVRAALEARGYRVDRDVGVGGCRIELGVRHPDDDSRYVLGIECDGRVYATARTARDRDLLRHAALEAKGWRLHRVWSTDWFRERDRALERLLRAISRARASSRPNAGDAAAGAIPA